MGENNYPVLGFEIDNSTRQRYDKALQNFKDAETTQDFISKITSFNYMLLALNNAILPRKGRYIEWSKELIEAYRKTIKLLPPTVNTTYQSTNNNQLEEMTEEIEEQKQELENLVINTQQINERFGKFLENYLGVNIKDQIISALEELEQMKKIMDKYNIVDADDLSEELNKQEKLYRIDEIELDFMY